MSGPAIQQLSDIRRFVLLFVVLLGTLLGPLDSAVNVAFPDITESFAIELISIRWVVIAYVATYASLMLVFGRIGDLVGHNRIFLIGLVVCSLAFAMCSFANSYSLLLAARILQGIGTALVLSCGPALATSLFSERRRARILGVYAMMFGLGGALGPSLGGWLVGYWGWPAVFWFRLPLALFALLLAVVLRVPAPDRDQGLVDLKASLLLALTTVLLLICITQLHRLGDLTVMVVVLSAGTASSAFLFIRTTMRSSNPILDLRAFSDLSFAWINVATVVVNLAGFATMLFVPYFLVGVSELTLAKSGLIMATGPAAMMIASNVAGQAIGSVGASRLGLIGSGLVAAGLLWVSYWDASTTTTILCSALILHGTGLGLFQVACLEFIAAALPKSNRGVAGSLALVMRTIGVVIAASVLTLAFAHFQANPGVIEGRDDFVTAFQTVFRYASLGLAIFIVASLVRTNLWLNPPR